MISDKIKTQLEKLTGDTDLENSISKLIQEYIEIKLSYWKIIDKQMEISKGMSFQEYQDTQYNEWDGIDWDKKEEFLDWEAAIAAINHFTFLKEQWTSSNLS
ncbi:MAG: hypothetical protein H7A25_20025 [Leptospiraceae bacterium]|nr:hypothetical protein [Leptospiraceae bacterium]MCP5502197.1 hypothetical protein [Leptospiraceae bacterium]